MSDVPLKRGSCYPQFAFRGEYLAKVLRFMAAIKTSCAVPEINGSRLRMTALTVVIGV